MIPGYTMYLIHTPIGITHIIVKYLLYYLLKIDPLFQIKKLEIFVIKLINLLIWSFHRLNVVASNLFSLKLIGSVHSLELIEDKKYECRILAGHKIV
jgi:hypothetical protein